MLTYRLCLQWIKSTRSWPSTRYLIPIKNCALTIQLCLSLGLEYVNMNDMALQLYGKSDVSEAQGVLRLKLMWCLIGILQDEHALRNVDYLLSVCDIACLTHCGSVIQSTNTTRQFVSTLYNIFQGDIVLSQFKALLDVGLPVLIAPIPLQFNELISEDKWNTYFRKKLKSTKEAATFMQDRGATILASVRIPGMLNNRFVRFPTPSVQYFAVTQPAGATDHVRVIAKKVKQLHCKPHFIQTRHCKLSVRRLWRCLAILLSCVTHIVIILRQMFILLRCNNVSLIGILCININSLATGHVIWIRCRHIRHVKDKSNSRTTSCFCIVQLSHFVQTTHLQQ